MDERDLARALSEGIIGGAAVDALVMEPMQKGNPLLDAPNITIIIIPYICGL